MIGTVRHIAREFDVLSLVVPDRDMSSPDIEVSRALQKLLMVEPMNEDVCGLEDGIRE